MTSCCYHTVPSATWEIFSEFLIFCNLLIVKYEKRGKYLPILHEATWDNYFIVKYLLKSNESREILLTNCIELAYFGAKFGANFVWKRRSKKCKYLLYLSYFVFPNSFVFPYFNSNILYSVYLFGIRWSFAIDLFSNVLFQKSITFESMYLISCWFHCVDIFYIKFRFCKTYTVTSSVTKKLLIETLSNFRTIKCWFTRYLDMYVLG